MSRSREFGPTIFQRFEQSRLAKDAMYARVLKLQPAPMVDTGLLSAPVARVSHGHSSRVILSAIGLLSIFYALNSIDRPSIVEASKGETATPTPTATKIPTPTRTPTSEVSTRATVVISGEQGVNVQIDNTNSNSNDLTQRLIDALLRPVPTQAPTSSPRPTDTPTPTDADNDLAAARTAVAEGKKEKTAGDLLGQATALAQPTPDRTATREAQKTAGREEILGRQATLTAAVPRDIARAEKTAAVLAIQEQAAELEAENRRTEERIRKLRGEVVPTPVPSGTPRPNEGDFPWLVTIIAATGLGAIYLLRRRIIPPPVVPAGAPPVPLTFWQRIRASGGRWAI